MNAALERIEPILCFALARARESNWPLAHGAVRACTEFAELHRVPEPASYDPESLLQRAASAAGRPVNIGNGRAAPLTGDAEQLAALLHAFLRSAILEHDAELCADVVDVEDVSLCRLRIDGPGRFPDPLQLGFDLTLQFSDAESIWTSATRGGRIDGRPGELDLRLKGVRAIHDVPAGCESVAGQLRETERLARVLASGEFAAGDANSVLDQLTSALAEFDTQDDTPKPCDIAGLVRECFAAEAHEGEPVRAEIVAAPDLPPISVRRNRIVRLCRSLGALGRSALSHGGSLRIEIDYDLSQRTLLLNFFGQGKTDDATVALYLPTVERVAGGHGGEVLADVQSEGFALLIAIPDTVARTLDEWLPGWDVFAARSIQMLRLLKSGGPVPPEELILNGVLEDELERRLLPRLGVAPAATLIHDLRPRTPTLSSSSAQRIEKVRSQLKRGKPKKEICAPPYAAEILWMFSCDDRHASAVGLIGASQPEVSEFCKVLAANPIDHLRALGLLARVLRPLTSS